MPPHSSHLLQPLDIDYFEPLKKAYGQEIEYLIKYSIIYILKTEFLCAFYVAVMNRVVEPDEGRDDYA
jgi:hypothetical protein